MSAITNTIKFIGSIIHWIIVFVWTILMLPFTFLGWLSRRSLLWWMTFIVAMLMFVFPIIDAIVRNS